MGKLEVMLVMPRFLTRDALNILLVLRDYWNVNIFTDVKLLIEITI